MIIQKTEKRFIVKFDFVKTKTNVQNFIQNIFFQDFLHNMIFKNYVLIHQNAKQQKHEMYSRPAIAMH